MHERRAHAYMDIWRTGDADEADHIMVDDVAMVGQFPPDGWLLLRCHS